MKSINFLLFIAAILFTCNTGFAQSSKANDKAVEKANKLDEQLKSENPALALTEAQKEKIVALQVERMNEVSAFRKSNSDKEAAKAKSKELNKAMNAKINSEILTAEQAQAQKDYRKKMKGQNGKGGAKADKTSMKPTGKKAKGPAVAAISVAEADKICAAADAKQKAKAEKSTEKLNAGLTASNASLALSADQRMQINAVNIQKLAERAKMAAAGMSKEEIKEKGKEGNKKNKAIIKSILTKEQNAAIKAAKSK